VETGSAMEKCGRDERRRNIKRADGEATSRFHVLTTLQRNSFGSTHDSCCAFGVLPSRFDERLPRYRSSERQ
jgi:hypothetical protein